MAVTSEVIVPPKHLESVQTTQYTAENATVIIGKCTVTNISASNVLLYINIVPDGSAPSASNLIIKARSLAPNEVYECPPMINHLLKNGYSISAYASAATSLTMMVSGSVITG
jgi:hypothetical protein